MDYYDFRGVVYQWFKSYSGNRKQFIKTDSKSSKLFFYNPNPMINFTSINVRNNYNYEWIYFTPKPKTLILFPSWLQHGSNNTLNKSSQRIVVSFNYL